MAEKRVKIEGAYIKLQDLVKYGGAAETGGQAKIIIQSGKVKVNGETCTIRGKKLRSGDYVETDGLKIIAE